MAHQSEQSLGSSSKLRPACPITAHFCLEIYRGQYDSQPPVIIVRVSAQILLENNFEAFNFVEIHKEKIVKLDWKEWNMPTTTRMTVRKNWSNQSCHQKISS